MPKPRAQVCHQPPGEAASFQPWPGPRRGAHGHSLPASPQAPPLLNSSVPGRPEPVTPINRSCIHQEGAWAASTLKPGKTSGSCQLEVGEVREVGHFLPGLPESWPGPGRGLPGTQCAQAWGCRRPGKMLHFSLLFCTMETMLRADVSSHPTRTWQSPGSNRLLCAVRLTPGSV